ncbi:MAG: molecular chaperone HtpG [Chitinophagales bacterium]
MSTKGKIKVDVENIFPLIKKFLYSDHEIFLRELVSNATDATLKLKHLTSTGKASLEYGSPIIEIKIDKEGKKLHIIDQGIGMTAEEVEKYINQVAFSGAEEFINKYTDSKDSGIIGHFGLGFYSAFMVADKVEIITKSYTDAPAAHWACDGSPEYTLDASDKTERGSEIILHINAESEEFLEESKIKELLNKYNKFMPIPIKFGIKTESLPLPEGSADDAKPETIEVDNIINNPVPAWTKKPSELKDEDYNNFYRELYPYQFEQPLFHIHLNVDFPFNLTGILYFPKLNPNLQIQKDKIQLYQNQVFITDNVEGIVPEYLTMLRGVIDSPDIPLNVSRSYLQADNNVKKISEYVTKKVAEKLQSLLKDNREDYASKWNETKIVIEYGCLTDQKFMEKYKTFMLFPTVNEEYLTWDEMIEKTKTNQTDKDENHIILYSSDKEKEFSYLKSAQDKGYEVILLDSQLVPHLVQKFESENEKLRFVRIDSGHIDELIKKEETSISKLSDKEKEDLKAKIEEVVPKATFSVQTKAMDSADQPFLIVQSEWMRRMKDMQATGGGGFMAMGGFPDSYELVINENHAIASKILEEKDNDSRAKLIQKAFDIARLSQGLLKGQELNNFIQSSFENI